MLPSSGQNVSSHLNSDQNIWYLFFNVYLIRVNNAQPYGHVLEVPKFVFMSHDSVFWNILSWEKHTSAYNIFCRVTSNWNSFKNLRTQSPSILARTPTGPDNWKYHHTDLNNGGVSGRSAKLFIAVSTYASEPQLHVLVLCLSLFQSCWSFDELWIFQVWPAIFKYGLALKSKTQVTPSTWSPPCRHAHSFLILSWNCIIWWLNSSPVTVVLLVLPEEYKYPVPPCSGTLYK